MSEPFRGNEKVGKSFLHGPEQRFITWATPRVPLWIQTYHLTLASIPISLLIVAFSFLAANDVHWLWAVSGLIALQWLTDSLDGAVGRARNTGLVRWGYYMDHLLDYFFLASVLIGYMILLPDKSKWIFFFVFALFAGFMVNAFLSMAASNRFRISYFGAGPTEIRLVFIFVNSLLALFGKTHLAFLLPFLIGLSFLAFVVVAYLEQRALWKTDMETKNKS